MKTTPTVLIVEDEAQIRRLLQRTLESEGYRLRFAVNGSEGKAMAGTERPEVVLLDLGLPDVDGTDVLASIRAWSRVPVIILSIRSAESDIISCLDAGADDYLVKPFRTGELLARIRTALRRTSDTPAPGPLTVGSITMDFERRTVMKDGVALHLTGTEYALLSLFMQNAGRVLTHRFLLEHVWGPKFLDEAQYTRVYVRQLRKKIEDDPSNPTILLTESGIGYRLSADPSAQDHADDPETN